MIRRYNEQVLEERDLSGEARRASPRMLNVRFGKEFTEATGVMRVYGCDISIKQRRSDRDGGPALGFCGRSRE
jgi:hypothetical protein